MPWVTQVAKDGINWGYCVKYKPMATSASQWGKDSKPAGCYAMISVDFILWVIDHLDEINAAVAESARKAILANRLASPARAGGAAAAAPASPARAAAATMTAASPARASPARAGAAVASPARAALPRAGGAASSHPEDGTSAQGAGAKRNREEEEDF